MQNCRRQLGTFFQRKEKERPRSDVPYPMVENDVTYTSVHVFDNRLGWMIGSCLLLGLVCALCRRCRRWTRSRLQSSSTPASPLKLLLRAQAPLVKHSPHPMSLPSLPLVSIRHSPLPTRGRSNPIGLAFPANLAQLHADELDGAPWITHT
ncbi:hypothetical protein B0J12DRAFT_110276 [Macrophomina phaseolina]|uniref:Uncharacterized protein n=1 Tax=Macrophomina phaseolina TaxID=35725 RepID=A0ABQ8G8I2_9PEZI|nr:hypothetical protein B0J12DRAFT_110276 [Macrophomina phaseolina]